MYGRFKTIFLLSLFCLLLSACSDSGSQDLKKAADEALENREYQTAADAYRQLSEQGADLQENFRGLGIAQMGLGQYEEAKESFEKALSEGGVIPEPISYDINYYLASCYYKTGEVEKAEEVYNAILALRPSDTEGYRLRASTRLRLGDTAGARADFDKVLQLTPTDFDGILNIYEILKDYGMQEEGERYLRRTLEEQEKNLNDFERGRLLFYLGEYQEAKSYLEQARAASGNYRTTAMLGQTYEELGDYNYAVSVYETFLNQDTTHAQIYNRLGLCYMKMGKYQEALRAFEQGKITNNPDILQDLSFNEIVAHEYLGEWKKAAVLMEAYLQNYPNDETAVREYAFLKNR